MKTAVVILNWNGRNLLEKFLPGVISKSENATVIVADNASSDDSVDFLKKEFPGIQVLESPVNEGFAQGYNTALKKVDATYYVLLNSDVEVTDGWLKPVIDYLDQHPETAVCQPKIRWYHHKEQFEYAGASGGYIDKLGYPFCRGRIFQTLETDHGQYDSISNIFWATGACMVIRADVFHKAGGFDAAFFAHMEEIDLCWRIRNLGYQIACVPSSTVFHMGGATLPKHNPRKTLLNFRNNLSMLYKNLSTRALLPVILIRLILDGIAGIKFMIDGDFGDCFAVIKAHFQFYGRVLSGKIKRTHGPKPALSTVYKGSILIDYYIRKKQKFSDLHFDPDKK